MARKTRKKRKENGYDDGSFVVKKSRNFNIFAFIVCLLVAFVIWVYAEGRTNEMSSDTTLESEQVRASVTETQTL